MIEALIIIVALGGLEVVLWLLSEKRNKKEMAEQTQLLEDIAVSLSIKEDVDVEQEKE